MWWKPHTMEKFIMTSENKTICKIRDANLDFINVPIYIDTYSNPRLILHIIYESTEPLDRSVYWKRLVCYIFGFICSCWQLPYYILVNRFIKLKPCVKLLVNIASQYMKLMLHSDWLIIGGGIIQWKMEMVMVYSFKAHSKLMYIILI